MTSSRLRNVFTQRHVLLPVIHAESETQALRNAHIAHAGGCDGIFLINHSISHDELMQIHQVTAQEFPEWWIGINSLGAAPAELFSTLPASVAGLWVDNAGIDERKEFQGDAERVAIARRQSGWPGLYFGGVAFKYQRPVADFALAAKVATAYVDVITTSGPGTGQAASPGKIAAMKRAVGDFPVGIASGITPDNVAQYLGIADCFLVATGISDSFTELNADKVAELVRVVRDYQ